MIDHTGIGVANVAVSAAFYDSALGALGMLAFAIVFSLMVERSIAAAFVGASFAWLAVSVAAWYLRRNMRSVQRRLTSDRTRGSAVSRSR